MINPKARPSAGFLVSAVETTLSPASPSTTHDSKPLSGNSISETHRIAQCGGHAVPQTPSAPSPHQSSSPLLRGRIRIVLCEPRAHRHQRNSRIPASGAPRRFLWCRFRARLPASSPDPAPKQQPAAQWPRHRPCTQPNRQRPHPYFFATLPPPRLLLRRINSGASLPRRSPERSDPPASVDRTGPRAAHIEIRCEKVCPVT